MPTSTRISNRYLLRMLSELASVACGRSSLGDFVSAWRGKGYDVDDQFFLHLDTLEIYGFVQVSTLPQAQFDFSSLLQKPLALEGTVSITDAGIEFLHRYG